MFQATNNWEIETPTDEMDMVKDCCWYMWDLDVDLIPLDVYNAVVYAHGNVITLEQVESIMKALVVLGILKY